MIGTGFVGVFKSWAGVTAPILGLSFVGPGWCLESELSLPEG